MKCLLIITIICLTGMQVVWSATTFKELLLFEQASSPANLQKYSKACARELNIPVSKWGLLITFEAISYFYPGPKTNKAICMGACIGRKMAESRGLTFYQSIQKNFDIIYDFNLNNLKSSKVSREELKAKVDYCYAKEGDNECEMYKCLDFTKPPYYHAITFLAKPLFRDLIDLIFH